MVHCIAIDDNDRKDHHEEPLLSINRDRNCCNGKVGAFAHFGRIDGEVDWFDYGHRKCSRYPSSRH